MIPSLPDKFPLCLRSVGLGFRDPRERCCVFSLEVLKNWTGSCRHTHTHVAEQCVCVWLCMMGHIGYTILQYWSVLNLLVNHCFCFLTTSSLQGSMAAGSNTTNLIVWDSRLIWYNAYRHLIFSCLNHLIKGRFRRVCEVAALLLMKDRCAHLAFTAISALCILIVDVVTGEETYSKKRTAARSQTYCVSHRFAKRDRRGSHIYRFGSRTKPPAFSALSSVCPNIHIMTFTTRGFLDHA